MGPAASALEMTLLTASARSAKHRIPIDSVAISDARPPRPGATPKTTSPMTMVASATSSVVTRVLTSWPARYVAGGSGEGALRRRAHLPHQLAGRAAHADAPAGQDGHPVGQPLRLVEVVGG